MMVTPAARSDRTISHMSLRSSTSTPAVGSSRNRICGSCESAFAIRTRRFVPPDNVKILLSLLSQSDSRSEEHTSELQSHVNLVCRLLLEKKKKKKKK